MTGSSGILVDGRLVAFEAVEHSLPPRLRHQIAARLMAPPPVRHAEPTVVCSLDDEPWRPNKRLFDLAARLAAESPSVEHPLLGARPGTSPRWFEVFPGEHYHLLTAACRILEASIVWEFGTDTGMGTVALSEGIGKEGKVFTVDIDPWTSKQGPWVIADDFAGGRIIQIISDMKDAALFATHAVQLAEADLIFVDGPKDGFTESAFLERLMRVSFRKHPIVIFDDIRLMTMLTVWRGIQRPKMDLTSFGHWSGTGLIDWTAAL
jgi:predicted O-methyltransferase YrrM